jgi:dTDP-4-dehydrorhamnose reductase
MHKRETKKVLITGVTGMLGSDLVKTFSSLEQYEVFGLGRSLSPALPRENQFVVDLMQTKQIEEIPLVPDIIIHTAAITDLSLCEKEPTIANQVNVVASAALAGLCNREGTFLYVSTDSVFDGTKGNYAESDTPNPLNVYAKSKLNGEYEVQKEMGERAIILRTNIYGFHLPLRNSMAEWAYQEWMLGKTISGFTDTIFNAVHTYQLAHVMRKIIENGISHPVINIGSNESISKFEFLERLRQKLNVDKAFLKPALSTVFPSAIKRPKNTSLNTTLLSTFCSVPDFESGITDWLNTFSIYEKTLTNNLK